MRPSAIASLARSNSIKPMSRSRGSSISVVVRRQPPLHADCVPWAFDTSQLHGLALTEWHCRTADPIDPARVFGPHRCLGRGTSAPDSEILRRLLQRRQNASVIEQRRALSPGSAIQRHNFTRHPGRASSPITFGFEFSVHTGGILPSSPGRPFAMTYDKAGPLADFATGPALSAPRHRRSRRHPTRARTAR
jgi:hypothetical protein